MKRLTEQQILQLMREEWNKRVESFLHENIEEKKKKSKPDTDLSVEVPVKGKKEVVISPGLKVKSKPEFGQGLLYTVASVNPTNKTIVLSHEKDSGTVKRTVTWDEFNKQYERQ